MTLEQRIDQLSLMIKRNDERNKVHDEEIRFAMANAYAQLIYEAYRKNDLKTLEFFSRDYTSQKATYNSSTLEYEIVLTMQILSSPDDHPNDVVRTVNYNAGEDIEFVAMTRKEYELMKNQDVFTIDDAIPYVVEANKIIFLAGIDEDNEYIFTTTGLRLSLVVALDEYDYDDILPIPHGRELDFMIMVFQFLGLKVPVELLNRNE